jgi:hypothetical protein
MHPGDIGAGLEFHHRGKPVLRLERLPHRPVASTDAGTDQSPIEISSGIEEIIEVHGLVGAVKVTNTNMQDASLKLFTGISRLGDAGRQVREISEIQALVHEGWT